MSTPVSEQEKCSYCQKVYGRANLRKCSKCKFVRYCSKDCQAKAWPTHKASCVVTAQLHAQLQEDPERKAKNDALSRWIVLWKSSINQCALTALNLANNPAEDHLATHNVVIEIEPLPNPRHRANWFRMTGGSVMNNEEWVQRMREKRMDESVIEDWVKDKRGNGTVRIIISTSEGFMRFLYFSLLDKGASWRRVDPVVSNDLAAMWAESLAFAFEDEKGLALFPKDPIDVPVA
ncbi:hypothetical protein EWM64_g6857 [Hericium alpestre]|uniref:MYND-type domain-containing protein n=1 Tax=Hericium alpestre TaxID=135208 RepID=A0A4Y9ZSA4_9AGAM|nr:hypothetical protein EWM64_g6857 [Hericium alpestre]